MRMWWRQRSAAAATAAAATTEGSLCRAYIEQRPRPMRPSTALAALRQKCSAHMTWKRRRSRPSCSRTLHRAVVAREAASDAGAEVMLLTCIRVSLRVGCWLVRFILDSMKLEQQLEHHVQNWYVTPVAKKYQSASSNMTSMQSNEDGIGWRRLHSIPCVQPSFFRSWLL